MSNKTRNTKRLLLFVAVGLALLVSAAAHKGWFTKPMPWQEATGWDLLPEDLRAPFTVGDAGVVDEPMIYWLGHSGFLIRWHEHTLLLDPNLSDTCTVVKRVLEKPVSPSDLGVVDVVLLSHAHYDHMDLPTLESLPGVDTLVFPVGNEVFLPETSWPNTVRVPMQRGETQTIGPFEITAVRVEHNGGRYHPFTSRQQALGYVVTDGRRTLIYAGDTAVDNDWAAIRDAHHPDLAILPIGGYAPRIPLKIHHVSPEETVYVAEQLGVTTVVPCHFGTFALTMDKPWIALPKFAREANERGVRWLMPRLLEPGMLPPPKDALIERTLQRGDRATGGIASAPRNAGLTLRLPRHRRGADLQGYKEPS